jgi:hypothetical protein
MSDHLLSLSDFNTLTNFHTEIAAIHIKGWNADCRLGPQLSAGTPTTGCDPD